MGTDSDAAHLVSRLCTSESCKALSYVLTINSILLILGDCAQRNCFLPGICICDSSRLGIHTLVCLVYFVSAADNPLGLMH